MIRKRLALLTLLAVVMAGVASASGGIFLAKNPSALFFALGKHYFSNGDFEKAVYFFTKVTEIRPDFAEAYHNLGISYYYSGHADEALKFLEKSVELKENYAKAHYSLGLVYFGQRDFEKAIYHLSRAAELDPENANAHFDLAVAHAEKFRQKEMEGTLVQTDFGNLKKASAHYLIAEELNPGFPHASGNAKIVDDILEQYGAAWQPTNPSS